MLPFAIFVLCCQLINATDDPAVVTAESGQGVVILPCRCSYTRTDIAGVLWTRTDLMGHEYVLLYRDKHYYPDFQHPSFKHRVYLQHRERNEEDVSLILRNVTFGDAGIYSCSALIKGRHRTKRAEETIATIHLIVVPKGHKSGNETGYTKPVPTDHTGGKQTRNVRLTIGLSLGLIVVLIIVAIGCVIHRRNKTPCPPRELTV